jgi:hypothetical protein
MAVRESNHVVIVVMVVRESNHVVIVVIVVRESNHVVIVVMVVRGSCHVVIVVVAARESCHVVIVVVVVRESDGKEFDVLAFYSKVKLQLPIHCQVARRVCTGATSFLNFAAWVCWPIIPRLCIVLGSFRL